MLSVNLFTSLAILCLVINGSSFPHDPQDQKKEDTLHTVTILEETPTVWKDDGVSTIHTTLSAATFNSTESSSKTFPHHTAHLTTHSSKRNTTHSQTKPPSTLSSTPTQSKHNPTSTTNTTKSYPTEDAETECAFKFRLVWSHLEIHGQGWNPEKLNRGGPGKGLKKELTGCSPPTFWKFKPGEEPGEFTLSCSLLPWSKSCVQHAMVSAGGPQVKCKGGII